MSSNFGQIQPLTSELSALERLNYEFNLLASFLIESSLFLQLLRTAIKSRMTLKFGQIRPLTAELPDLERLEKSP